MIARLTERTKYGIVGNNDMVKNYPLYKVANSDPLDHNITKQCFEKLAKYEDDEEQGLLLRLPVSIGATVYKFEPLGKESKGYIKTTVTRYEVFDDSIWFTFANGLGRKIEDFGKFVFLTEDEAKKG